MSLIIKYSHCNNNQFKVKRWNRFYVVKELSSKSHLHPQRHQPHLSFRRERDLVSFHSYHRGTALSGFWWDFNQASKTRVCQIVQTSIFSYLIELSTTLDIPPHFLNLIVCLTSSMFVQVLALKWKKSLMKKKQFPPNRKKYSFRWTESIARKKTKFNELNYSIFDVYHA